MGNKTATETEFEKYQREMEVNRLYKMHESFRARWAPEDPRDRDQFEAELAMLVRECAIDALKPFQAAAATQLAMLPQTPFVVKSGK